MGTVVFLAVMSILAVMSVWYQLGPGTDRMACAIAVLWGAPRCGHCGHCKREARKARRVDDARGIQPPGCI